MWLILILVGLAMILFGVLVEAAQVLIWLGVILAAVQWCYGSSATPPGRADVAIQLKGPRSVLRGPLSCLGLYAKAP